MQESKPTIDLITMIKEGAYVKRFSLANVGLTQNSKFYFLT